MTAATTSLTFAHDKCGSGMMQMRLAVSGLFSVLLLVSMSQSTTQAAADPAKIVKDRQEFMGSFWKQYLKSLAPIAKGDSSDTSMVAEKAAGLAAAAKKIGSYFPEGTGRDVVPSSRARPEVWTDAAGFKASIDTFVQEATKLETVAHGGSLEPIKAQISATFQACFGCHQGPEKSGGKYRFEEK